MDILRSKKRIGQSTGPGFPFGKSIVASFALVIACMLILAWLADPRSGEIPSSKLGWTIVAGLPAAIAVVFYLEFRLANKRRSTFPQRRGTGVLRLFVAFAVACCISQIALCQKPLSWTEIQARFKTTNPTLQAARIGIDESRAQEITANLRPNPAFTGTLDQIDPFTTNPYRPLGSALPFVSSSYLHERQHKRELRLDSARQATAIATSQLADQERTLLFNLRNAFVQNLQQKAILALAQENLAYYDQVLRVSRDRRQAGDIAQVDLDRLELQRVQYETDLQTATVNLRTAKIQLLTLLNDRTPVEQFEVAGPYDFPDQVSSLEDLRSIALDTRPDLKAAMQAVEKARTDNRLAWANGSTDPTFGVDFARNPPIPAYFGFSVTIPLRIFDRNQGEKARTQLDVNRTQRLRDATEAQVFSDVDSAYAAISSNLTLLRTYRTNYLRRAGQVRDTILFAYRNGGASLIDFLQAQQDYRSVQLNYLNLIGAYLTAASQMNLAVGREVIS
jgi:cobalt-zinc-cadmium efflux system outer membrane protein